MEELQERSRSAQASQRQRVGGVVPSVGPELEAEVRKRDKAKQRLVVTWHKLVGSPSQPQPQRQQQSVAPPVVSGPQTVSLTYNSDLDITVPSAHEDTVRGALSNEREIEHEQFSVTNAIVAEELDALSRDAKKWACDCTTVFLRRHAHGQQMTFTVFLQPYATDELGDAKFGKRSYLAIPINRCVDRRLKINLQKELDYLMQDWDRSDRFEVRVSSAVGQKMKGDLGDEMGLLLGPHPMTRVAFPASRSTLCAARITLAIDHSRTNSDAPMWTCGGLISVEDRIYALTVSHPLEPQEEGKDEMESNDQTPGRNFRANVWSHLGRAAFRNSSSDSRLSGGPGEIDSDWMLVEVQKAMQLPNIALPGKHLSDPYVRDCSTSPGRNAGRRACLLLTARGPIPGTVVEGTTCLVFGTKTFWAMQVQVEAPLLLGDSGSWVINSNNNAIIGVVIAGADSLLDGASGPVAFVLRMADIYTALAQVIPNAQPRMLSNTENAILDHRHKYPKDDNLLGLWDFYVADIINRFHQSIGEIQPRHLIIDDMPSIDSDLRPFLMLGQAFPCQRSVRERLRAKRLKRWQLRFRGFGSRTLEIWNRLQEFERGENFIVLLKFLVQSGLQSNSDSIARLTATEVVRNLILYSDLPESARPGSGLINDLVRLVSITSFLSRSLEWGHKIFATSIPPWDVACILAKASYAERHRCFFVYRGPLAFGIRLFMFRACSYRRISAWEGKARASYAADVQRLRETGSTPSAPCLFIGDGHDKDFPKTGRLIRCPDLYEHLHVGAEDDSVVDIAGVSNTMRRPRVSLATDQPTMIERGSQARGDSKSGSLEVKNGHQAVVTINSHVNNFFETHKLPPGDNSRSTLEPSVTVSDARGSLTERQLDDVERRTHTPGSLASGAIEITNGHEARVQISSNVHNHYGPSPLSDEEDPPTDSGKQEKQLS